MDDTVQFKMIQRGKILMACIPQMGIHKTLLYIAYLFGCYNALIQKVLTVISKWRHKVYVKAKQNHECLFS